MNQITCSCCQRGIDNGNLIRILKEERELNDLNFSRLRKALSYKKTLCGDGDRIYLTVDSLITINNIITNSNNFYLQRTNVRAAGTNKQYMDFYSIEPALQGLVDNYNLGRVTPKTFAETFLKIHTLLDRNGRTCKLLVC